MATKKKPHIQAATDTLDYDAMMAEFRQPAAAGVPQDGMMRRYFGDTAISAVKGAIGLPEAAVGLADLVTGGRAGKLAEEAGFRPAAARRMLDEYLSADQRAANERVQQADGFVGN